MDKSHWLGIFNGDHNKTNQTEKLYFCYKVKENEPYISLGQKNILKIWNDMLQNDNFLFNYLDLLY
jgi:hypothetical protein